ncbi:MAG: DMT family transporter [Buchnera aphidicola (Eriosoma harunire)]
MSKLLIVLLFFVVAITWGTTWIAMKIVLLTIPPLCATSMRFLITAPVLIGIAIFTKKPLLFPPNKKIFQFFICIFYFLVPFTLMLYGGSYVISSFASMIFSSMPVLMLVVSIITIREKICVTKIIGILISIVSLIVIIIMELHSNSNNNIKGVIALLLAVLSHSIIYVKSKYELSKISVFTLNALPSLFSGFVLLILSIFVEHPNVLNFSIESILALLYLGNISGVCGILSYFYLQTKVSMLQASIVFLIFPLISLVLEYYIFDNIISYDILCMYGFLMIGLCFTLYPCNFFKKRRLI